MTTYSILTKSSFLIHDQKFLHLLYTTSFSTQNALLTLYNFFKHGEINKVVQYRLSYYRERKG